MATCHLDSARPEAAPLVLPAPSARADSDPGRFQRQLTVATLGLLFVVLLMHVLGKLAVILQPLLIAAMFCYVVFPVHEWFVHRGLPSKLAYSVILVLTLALLLGVGHMVYANLNDLNPERLQQYERQFDEVVRRGLRALGTRSPDPETFHVRDLLFSETGLNVRVRTLLLDVTGSFLGFLTAAFVVFLYLIFLLAETNRAATRLAVALGPSRAEEIAHVILKINRAISEYIGLKAFVSFLQAFLSLIVFVVFDVDFAMMWGVLIFLLNFIPYLGSIIAVSLPVLLSFLKYVDEPWKGATVLMLLLAIQRVIDNWIEPRLAGQKLGLSPLLVLLALAFWGWLWGIVGMILAVPLTVTIKIILENVKETRPIAMLMSNIPAAKPSSGTRPLDQGPIRDGVPSL